MLKFQKLLRFEAFHDGDEALSDGDYLSNDGDYLNSDGDEALHDGDYLSNDGDEDVNLRHYLNLHGEDSMFLREESFHFPPRGGKIWCSVYLAPWGRSVRDEPEGEIWFSRSNLWATLLQ